MAIFEKTIRNQNFDTLLRKLEHAIPDSSWSAELEAGSDFKEGSARCSVRVFERYSMVGGNRFHAVIVQRAGLPRLLKFWDDLNYGNLLVGANSGSNHETLAQRQNGIHTKLYEALASGDTEVACRAVYAHYMEPMERMRSANSAVQAADEAAK